MSTVARSALFALALACALVATTSALAVPGALDRTFSGDGKVRTNFTAGDDFAGGVAVQADGKIVTAGRAGGLDEFALARYDPDGTLDTGFGGNGKVRTNFTGGFDWANGLALQADGKIVAVGRAGRRGGRFAVVRYDTDGTLDTTFSGDGKVATNFTAGEDFANGVAVQADGKIVVVGGVNFDKFALARYDTDGTLDTSFGGDGKVVTNFTGLSDWANGVAIQPNGKIVAAGAAGVTEFGGTFALARYDTDGTLDTTFSGDGKVTTDFTAEEDVAFAVALQANGRIVAAGGGDVSGAVFALARYNVNGALDSTFGGDGKVRTNFSGGLDSAHGVAVQADGKIVAGGHADFAMFALARYESNGSLDSSFSSDGKVRTNLTSGRDFANGVAIQADGDIVLAGRAGGRGGRFGLTRYQGA